MQEIRADAGVLMQIGDAARGGVLLLVIEVDPVVRDIVEIRRREIELRGIDFLALRALHREVQIRVEAAASCSSP